MTRTCPSCKETFRAPAAVCPFCLVSLMERDPVNLFIKKVAYGFLIFMFIPVLFTGGGTLIAIGIIAYSVIRIRALSKPD